jgi:hypothetical protein
MPQRALLTVPAALLALLATGCLDDKVDGGDTDRVRAAIERDVPAARVLEVRTRNALENCCGVDVSVATSGPATNDPAEARRLTRAVARAAGLNAPDGTVVAVANFVGGEQCGQPGSAGCWQDRLTVSAAEAAWLWADPPGPPPAPAQQKASSCEGGPDLPIDGLFLDPLAGLRPEVQIRARIEQAWPAEQARQGAERIAGFVWGCYPARLDTVTVTIQQPSGAGATNPPFRFTAGELRQRFGPRPDDVPQ